MKCNRSEEIAWAAGLFEGEGCISNTCPPYYYPHLQLNSTDEDVVRRFRKVIGLGYIRGPLKDHRKPHYKDQWQWLSIKQDDVLQILDLLKPWMGRRRSAKITEVLDKRREAKLKIANRKRK